MHERASIFCPISWSFEGDYGPDLGLREPPYTFTVPDAEMILAVQEPGNEDSLDLKLHALQCRWLLEEGAARFEAWSAPTLDMAGVVEAGIMELRARIHAWSLLERPGRWSKLCTSLREVYLDWGAKRVVWLVEELEIRQRGAEVYVAAFEQLPAQVLQRANEEYMAEDARVLDDIGEDEDDLFAEMYE